MDSFNKKKSCIVRAIKNFGIKSSGSTVRLHKELTPRKGLQPDEIFLNFWAASDTPFMTNVNDNIVRAKLDGNQEFIIKTGVIMTGDEFTRLAYELGGFDVVINFDFCRSIINARYAYSDCEAGQGVFDRLKKSQKIPVTENGTRVTFPQKFFCK